VETRAESSAELARWLSVAERLKKLTADDTRARASTHRAAVCLGLEAAASFFRLNHEGTKHTKKSS
jgi:hypothetical protein